jgi:thiol-disulfide isomerase/thioredoxin
MKNIILLCLSMAALASFAQTCKISGTINNPAVKEVYLFLLEGDTFFESPSARIPVAPNGSFSIKITVTAPVFARLIAGNKGQRLIISADRDINLVFHTTLHTKNTITGKGAIENNLVSNSVLSTTPFFIKRKYSAATLTPANWRQTIMQVVEQEIQTTSRQIQQANVPASIKTILTNELTYAYQCHLHDLCNIYLWQSKHPNRKEFLDSVMQWKPLPDSQALVSGFYANMMVDNHFSYAASSVVNKKDRQKSEADLAAYLKMPVDSIENLVKTYGEAVALGWSYARLYMPASIRDKILYNHIKEAANEGSLRTINYLFNILKKNFPQSPYVAKAKIDMQQIATTIKNNSINKRIVFKETNGIQSLSELVAPYKGKIVYLDIWGTWCGACKQEMTFMPELKKKYAEKDIVFVYLDNDNQSKDAHWREMVYHKGLEGEHYRMDTKAIERIWQAVSEAGGKTHLYPTYVIIDKDGKIVAPNAEQPGSREKIHAQLDKVL